jgi:hypothetical protein
MSRDEYTPTTEEVREEWVTAPRGDRNARYAEFDRWLAVVRCEAKAEALRDFANRKFGTVGPNRVGINGLYDCEMSIREEADRIKKGESA